MPLFNRETAIEMAKRSIQARKLNREKRLALAALAPFPQPNEADAAQQDMLVRTRLQIRDLDERLSRGNLTLEAWDSLTRAKERLFKVYAHLANLPGPGMYRPSRKTPRLLTLDAGPVEPVPIPDSIKESLSEG